MTEEILKDTVRPERKLSPSEQIANESFNAQIRTAHEHIKSGKEKVSSFTYHIELDLETEKKLSETYLRIKKENTKYKCIEDIIIDAIKNYICKVELLR